MTRLEDAGRSPPAARAHLKLVPPPPQAAPAPQVPLSPAQHALVESHLHVVPPAARRVKRIRPTALSLEDLIALGYERLSLAAQKFDEARGISFATYASFEVQWAMLSAIQHEARHAGLCGAMRRIGIQLLAQDDSRLTVHDIVFASEENMRGKMRDFLETTAAAAVLEATARTISGGEENEIESRDAAATARRVMREAIERDLHANQRAILDAVYERGLTVKQAAEEAGIPYATYKPHHRNALKRLATVLRQHGIQHAPPIVDLP
jgi:RNA polymerase sigma factor for flagellar operon FliA